MLSALFVAYARRHNSVRSTTDTRVGGSAPLMKRVVEAGMECFSFSNVGCSTAMVCEFLFQCRCTSVRFVPPESLAIRPAGINFRMSMGKVK